jgi:hypothetical protein
MSFEPKPQIRALESDFAPGYEVTNNEPIDVTADPKGALQIRGNVLTDEGGYRFLGSGSSFDVSIGTCTFTNGSSTVTGTALSSYDLHVGDYVKLNADGLYYQVEEFTSTTITLSDVYTGTGGSGASSCAVMKPVVGAGTTVAISGGYATITAGTTATSIAEIERDVDILPLVKETEIRISQRIANQDIYLGFYDESATTKYWAWFQFTGVNTDVVICETAFSRSGAPTATDKETTTVAIPLGLYTTAFNKYRIEVTVDSVRFLINGVVVAIHKKIVMRPVDILTSTLRCVNGTTPASSTTIDLNYDYVNNFNKVSVGFSDTDPNFFVAGNPQENQPGIPIKAVPSKLWRTGFSKVLASGVDSRYFNSIYTGTGYTVSQASGALTIVTGTTVNSELIIRSKFTVSDSWILKYQLLQTGTRAANNNFIIELVDVIGDNLSITVNSSTSVSVTIPNNPFTSENVGQSLNIGALAGFTGVTYIPGRYVIASVTGNVVTFTVAAWATGAGNTGTCSLFGWNYHQINYYGATATNCLFGTARQGWPATAGLTTATINTTLTVGHVATLINDDGVVSFCDQLAASSTANPLSTRATRSIDIPSNDTQLYLQIRALNGATVNSLTFSIGMIGIEDFSAMPVTIQSSRLTGIQNATPVNILASASLTVTGSVAGTQAADSATAVNLVKVGGLARTSNTAVTAGRASELVCTTVGAQTIKPFSIPELEYGVADSISNSTTAVQIKAATASNHNYVTGMQIQTDTLSGSSIFQLRSTPIASTTATISANTLVMSATYGWKVGDLVYVTASTVSGLSAGSYYYLLTVSTVNLTFSATRGGGTLSISGTNVSATLSKVFFKTTLQTTALPLTIMEFTNPLSGGLGLAIEAVTLTAVTGVVDINVQGYVAP